MSDESVDLAIRLLNNSDRIVGFIAMVQVYRENVPMFIAEDAQALLAELFPHERDAINREEQ